MNENTNKVQGPRDDRVNKDGEGTSKKRTSDESLSLGSNHQMLLRPLIHASDSHLTSNETTPLMSKLLNFPSSDIPGVPSFQKDYGLMSFSTGTLTSTKSTPDIMHSMQTTDMHKQLEKSTSFSIQVAHQKQPRRYEHMVN